MPVEPRGRRVAQARGGNHKVHFFPVQSNNYLFFSYNRASATTSTTWRLRLHEETPTQMRGQKNTKGKGTVRRMSNDE